MKKSHKFTMNIGIISFLMMFIILCMLTFSILTLQSAKSNRDMAAKSITHKKAYYNLLNEGEQKLKTLDDTLFSLYQKYPNKSAYYKQLKNAITRNGQATLKDHILSFDVKNDKQKLHVEVEILYPGNVFYNILEWKVSPLKEWNPDQSLNIM